jgi:hypothetical protein
MLIASFPQSKAEIMQVDLMFYNNTSQSSCLKFCGSALFSVDHEGQDQEMLSDSVSYCWKAETECPLQYHNGE